MPSSPAVRRAGALALVLALAPAVVAYAAGGADTTIAVSPRVLVAAPDRSPVDFPGVAKARAGRPLPADHAAVGRVVRITRGREVAHAALRMTCPRGTTWRSAAPTGEIGLTVLDRVVSGKRSVLVMATLNTGATAAGDTATGAVYALCR
jgi:hypothetical protein